MNYSSIENNNKFDYISFQRGSTACIKNQVIIAKDVLMSKMMGVNVKLNRRSVDHANRMHAYTLQTIHQSTTKSADVYHDTNASSIYFYDILVDYLLVIQHTYRLDEINIIMKITKLWVGYFS